jgi:hypothetical protein
MSIGTTHLFSVLDKKSTALEGQRGMRLIAKADADKNYPAPHFCKSLFASVPVISDDAIIDAFPALITYVRSMILEPAQNAIAREYAIEDAGHTSINDAQINVAACLQWLEAESKGDRITKEVVQKWFLDTYEEMAGEYIALALKWDVENISQEQNKVLDQKINVLRDMFAGWCGGKYSPDMQKLKAMVKFAEFIGPDNMDARMKNYSDKATKMLAEKESELSANALGF